MIEVLLLMLAVPAAPILAAALAVAIVEGVEFVFLLVLLRQVTRAFEGRP